MKFHSLQSQESDSISPLLRVSPTVVETSDPDYNEVVYSVSDDFFDQSKINLKINNFGNDVRIGYMSNLMEEKGIVEFIESMIFLKEILFKMGQEGDYLAVAINKNFIQKSCYKSQEVKEGDYLEIVSPHPGG